MVNLAPHRGYIVADLSRTDVEDLFWLQSEIAVRVALRTAEAITGEQIGELGGVTASSPSRCVPVTDRRWPTPSSEFHRIHNLIADSGKLSWFLLSATRYTPPSCTPQIPNGVRWPSTRMPN